MITLLYRLALPNMTKTCIKRWMGRTFLPASARQPPPHKLQKHILIARKSSVIQLPSSRIAHLNHNVYPRPFAPSLHNQHPGPPTPSMHVHPRPQRLHTAHRLELTLMALAERAEEQGKQEQTGARLGCCGEGRKR